MANLNLGICYYCMRVTFSGKSICGRSERKKHGWDKWEDFCRKVGGKHETTTSEITLKWFYQRKQNS